MQKKQDDWYKQWDSISYKDSENKFLFQEWIYPNTLEDFKGKKVLDAGCGGGQQLYLIAPYAKKGVGVDLNTVDLAKKRNAKFKNIDVIEGDLAKIHLDSDFDIIYSIGVLHHTDNPTNSFENLTKHLKKNGRMIIWVYSYEGNFLNRTLVEGCKRRFLLRTNKKTLSKIAKILTAACYFPIYSVYLLPLRSLPYYYYFKNWRKLSFNQNYLNVFDKLNAPQTFFIPKSTVKKWFNADKFSNIHISSYNGVSWRASGTKK